MAGPVPASRADYAKRLTAMVSRALGVDPAR